MARSRWLRSRPMATANKLKAASTRQRVCQRARRAGKTLRVDSTDEFILSTDKPVALSLPFPPLQHRAAKFQNLMDCFSACPLVATDSVSDGLNWIRLSVRTLVPRKEWQEDQGGAAGSTAEHSFTAQHKIGRASGKERL